jgi:hypothetical protein
MYARHQEPAADKGFSLFMQAKLQDINVRAFFLLCDVIRKLVPPGPVFHAKYSLWLLAVMFALYLNHLLFVFIG